MNATLEVCGLAAIKEKGRYLSCSGGFLPYGKVGRGGEGGLAVTDGGCVVLLEDRYL